MSDDFNGDGYPDLAVTNSGSGTVSVLLGDGSGAFPSRGDFPVGDSPWGLATGDFNGDGAPDLAASNFDSGNVSILLGDGGGDFLSRTDFPVAAGSPRGIVAGDFNGDGVLDLAVTNFNAGSISVLPGDGTGAFGAATQIAVGSIPFRLAAADLDDDGDFDLAVANFSSGTVSVLFGMGGGAFGPPIDLAVPGPPRSVAIGDYNGDGNRDLAVTSGNPSPAHVSVLLGDGTGGFDMRMDFPVGLGPDGVARGDLNGDGNLDLVVANGDDPCACISTLEGTGSGAFGAAVGHLTGSSSQTIAIGDFNRDGKPDLAVANANDRNVAILLNETPTFGADLAVTNTVSPPAGVSLLGKITYTLTVTNDGPLDATEVQLTDTLPTGINLGYVDVIASQGACSTVASIVTCDLGNLSSGATATVTIVVHPLDTSLKTNVATAAANETDPDATNNTASVSSTLTEIALSDLTVTYTDSPDPVVLGTPLTYLATVTDLQDDCADDVTVTLTQPVSSEFVSIVPSQGTCTGLTCNLAMLCPAQSASVRLTVIPNAAGTIGSTATVRDRPADPADNNAATAVTTVARTTVSITATDPAAAELGAEPGTFTIARLGDTSKDLIVKFTLMGTAENGKDYELLPAVTDHVTIPRGQSSVAITVLPRDDMERAEGPETVIVTLADAPDYSVGARSATVTIADRPRWPVVSIVASDPNAAELGGEPGTFTITRVGDTTDDLVVRFTTEGTARSADDYDLLPGSGSSVTILAGKASASITVVPRDDRDTEGAESVTLTLNDGAEYDLGAETSATVTIADHSRFPTLTIAATDPDAAETGREPGLFTITRVGETTSDLVVSFTRAGTADLKDDYVLFPDVENRERENEVTILRGQTSVTVTVSPLEDGVVEGTETVTLNLIDTALYDLGAAVVATVTIADPLLTPVVTIAATDAAAAEPQRRLPADLGTFTITRVGGDISRDLQVALVRTETATFLQDYDMMPFVSGSVTIPRGMSSTTVTVEPLDDAIIEGPEIVTLSLMDRREYDLGAQTSATVTIADSDSIPVVTIAATDPAATEPPQRGLARDDRGSFAVMRTGDISREVTVAFRRTGTATVERDYYLDKSRRSTDNVVLGPYESSVLVPVIPVDDSSVEGLETVTLTLVDGMGYDIGTPASATVTIADAPLVPPDPIVTIVATDAEAAEPQLDGRRERLANPGTFTIAREGDIASNLVVSFLRTGTATLREDYDLEDSMRNVVDSVIIPARQRSVRVTVSPADDGSRAEGSESVTLSLVESEDYDVGVQASATVTIIDADSPPLVTIAASTPEVSESPHGGVTFAEFTITRVGNISSDLKIFFLRTGTATYQQDYDLGKLRAPIVDSVIIPRGEPSATVIVGPRDDGTIEGNETVTLTSIGGSDYSVGAQASATVTIVDDDGRPRR